MRLIVGAKVEGGEKIQHRSAVVAAVGAADRGAQGGAVGGPGRFRFAHQVAQGLLADCGVDHVAHGAVRVFDGDAGQPVEQGLLAADALEIVQQLLLDPVLGTGADVVHGLDQQLDERVGDGAPAQVDIGGEPGQAGRLGVAAQLVGRLDSDALAAGLQLGRAPVREQTVGQPEPAHRVEPGQLVAQAGDAGPAGAGAKMNEWRVHLPVRHRPTLGILCSLRTGRLHQRVEEGAHVRREPDVDLGIALLVVGAHGAPDDAGDAVGGGRLETECAAPGLGLRRDLTNGAGPGDDVVAQPGAEIFGVGDARLAEAEQGAYLRPLPLERAVV